MSKGITFVGLDAHKKAINVAMLLPGQRTPIEWELPNEPRAVRRMVKRIRREAPDEIQCCYEASPHGYSLQRQIVSDPKDGIICLPSWADQRGAGAAFTALSHCGGNGCVRCLQGDAGLDGVRRIVASCEMSQDDSVERREEETSPGKLRESSLAELLPDLRNTYAHGSRSLGHFGFRTLKLCAALINSLFG